MEAQNDVAKKKVLRTNQTSNLQFTSNRLQEECQKGKYSLDDLVCDAGIPKIEPSKM